MLTVAGLYVYPIKSLGGVSLSDAVLTERGFAHDRRWMLVDHQNQFLSQRSHPKMALLQVTINQDGLHVQHKQTAEQVSIPFHAEGDVLRVQVWSATCKAIEVSTSASDWFSHILNIPCRLVHMPDSTHRRVDGRYTEGKHITSFTDDFPHLLITEASLNNLNQKLAVPLPMDRFRPNIVVAGASAFEEDEWEHFRVNNIDFYGVKLCGRCPVTTVDQQTAIAGKEPLKTLATFRSRNNKVYFGQYLVHHGEGSISIDDPIEVLSRKDAIFSPAISS